MKAAKLDKIDASQQLINSVNRGGLWFISTAAQNIFVKTEQHFRKATEEETILRSISRDAIIVKCLKDVDIISNFKTVVVDDVDIISNLLLILFQTCCCC